MRVSYSLRDNRPLAAPAEGASSTILRDLSLGVIVKKGGHPHLDSAESAVVLYKIIAREG